MSLITKSSNLSPYLKATSQAVGSHVKIISNPAVLTPNVVVQPPPEYHRTSYGLTKALPKAKISAKSGGIGSFGGESIQSKGPRLLNY